MVFGRSSTTTDAGAATFSAGLASVGLVFAVSASVDLVSAGSAAWPAPTVTAASAAEVVLVASAVLTKDDVVAGAETSFGFGTNSLAWANSTGATSGRVTMTRAPSLVAFQSCCANVS